VSTVLAPLRGDPDGRKLVSLSAVERAGVPGLRTAPLTVRLVAENVMRRASRTRSAEQVDDALQLVRRLVAGQRGLAVAVEPTRVLLQDHSGIPALADIATIRTLRHEKGLDPGAVQLHLPTDLVVDHSVEAWTVRHPAAMTLNADREYALNGERYRFLRWAAQAWPRLRVVPPGAGIVHQTNLEHLAQLVHADAQGTLAPELVIGTDSHTPMMNALGVLGWGVGGLEATSVLLGKALTVAWPQIVAVWLHGRMGPGILAADVALALTQFLRARDVVDCFLEFHGPGATDLSVPDRATVANMAPEYGSTTALFCADERTLDYLRSTGRPASHRDLVQAYLSQQGLLGAPVTEDLVGFGRAFRFDLSTVAPSVAGPSRPRDRVDLGGVPAVARAALHLPAGSEHDNAAGG
jgi:aconitate hydratase